MLARLWRTLICFILPPGRQPDDEPDRSFPDLIESAMSANHDAWQAVDEKRRERGAPPLSRSQRRHETDVAYTLLRARDHREARQP